MKHGKICKRRRCCNSFSLTSQAKNDQYSLIIESNDFESGSLRKTSYVRINRLITVEQTLIAYKVGHLKETKTGEIINQLVKVLQVE